MPDGFDDYTFDDEIFAQDAGVNKITEAYAKVFQNIMDLAKDGKSFAESGSTKEVSSVINKIASRVSALVQIGEFDKKIVNSHGTVFNVFGKEMQDIETDDEDEENIMTESDLIDELNKIIDGCTNISLSEVMFDSEKNKENIEDDGLDHGDLDLIW